MNGKKQVSERRPDAGPTKANATALYKRSKTQYKLLVPSLYLSSGTTVLGKVPFDVGINDYLFSLMEKRGKTMKANDRLSTLMFDEVSIYPTTKL